MTKIGADGLHGEDTPVRYSGMFVVAKIFSTLAVCSVSLMVAVAVLGLTGGDYNAQCQDIRTRQTHLDGLKRQLTPDTAQIDKFTKQLDWLLRQLQLAQRRSAVHILLGILAALSTILVNCISVTYFIGTSRWCKEVTDTYGLSTDLVAESNRLKRRTFPWSVLGVVVVMGIVALGAAADPGTLRANTARWVLPHQWAALLGIALIAASLRTQVVKIRENSALIERILAQVQSVRSEKGLEIES